ncbi:MAG TPA: GNAT family N-acetyltransferase, partial [Aggregatilineales bacterium]|nr:GNAT family N-acetyltransferase [Aggregatilineales bacterium]
SVIVEAFEQYRYKLDPPSGVFRETPESIRQKIENGGFTACNGEKIIGAVLYEPHSDYMYLGRLAVLPVYRRRHIAVDLIATVEQAAHEQNLSRVRLGVRIGLEGNQRLFQNLGYQIIEQHSHEGYSEITYLMMEKRLTT